MPEICSICGEWELMNEDHWNFTVDEERGCSISVISEDISYKELIAVVLEDFAIDGTIKLSYASPSKFIFGTKEVLPVFIRNDRQVASFFTRHKDSGGLLQLCVTVSENDTYTLPLTVQNKIACINPLEMEIHRSPLIVSNMIQTGDEVSSSQDFLFAGYNKILEIERPLIVSNVIEPGNEVSSTQGLPIPGSSNILERITSPLILSNTIMTPDEITTTQFFPNVGEREIHTHLEIEPNNIINVDKVGGLTTPLISPSSSLVGNKRGAVVYGYEKSKLSSFSSRHGKENLGEDSDSYSEILSPFSSTKPHDDDGLVCGKFFTDKKEMSTELRLLAIKQSFEFRTVYSDRSRYILSCVDDKCRWSFRAKSVKGSQSFVVYQYLSEHTCDTSLRNVSHRQASAKLLGSMVSNHYEGGKIGLRPKQIIEKARKDHGVILSYSKAWRSQEHAQSIARGIPDDSFEALPSWFYMVKQKNPGSVVFIEVDSVKKFKYAFLAFGPSIRGFKLMRKVLSIDGAHLSSKYKGTLLAATAQDGNYHLYPIAFAVVDSENEDSWSWFMTCLKTIIPDEKDLVFVSDRAASIAKALSLHYPLAHHGICIFHFEKNLQKSHNRSGVIPLVVEAAYAYTKEDFSELFFEIQKSDSELADYLVEVDIRKWSRAYAPANRYNIMTSNLAESINSMLKLSREYPIVCLFDTIRMIMTKWFSERREKGFRHNHPVTLEVGIKMKEFYDDKSRWMEVSKINASEFEVKGDKRIHLVNFDTRHCSCCVFDIEKFPCAHAIAAAKAGGHHENEFVSEFFSNERFTLAYSESIYPVGDKAYWDVPSDVTSFVCRPPSTRFPSGRRKKNRIPSSWEYGKHRYAAKSYTCSRCGQQGHKRSCCVVPI